VVTSAEGPMTIGVIGGGNYLSTTESTDGEGKSRIEGSILICLASHRMARKKDKTRK